MEHVCRLTGFIFRGPPITIETSCLLQDSESILSDVRAIIAEQLGKDVAEVNFRSYHLSSCTLVLAVEEMPFLSLGVQFSTL